MGKVDVVVDGGWCLAHDVIIEKQPIIRGVGIMDVG